MLMGYQGKNGTHLIEITLSGDPTIGKGGEYAGSASNIIKLTSNAALRQNMCVGNRKKGGTFLCATRSKVEHVCGCNRKQC